MILILYFFYYRIRMTFGWQTQIKLISIYYTHLKCKIINKQNNQVLQTSLINRNCSTSLTIQKKPSQFIIVLLNDDANIVEEFYFGEKQYLQVKNKKYIDSSSLASSPINSKHLIEHKNVKFQSYTTYAAQNGKTIIKKQGDSCSISLTVKNNQSRMCSLDLIYDHLQQTQKIHLFAAVAYKKIEEKALKQIKRNMQKQKKYSLVIKKQQNQLIRDVSMNSTLNVSIMNNKINKGKNKEWLRRLKKLQKQNRADQNKIPNNMQQKLNETMQKSSKLFKKFKNKKNKNIPLISYTINQYVKNSYVTECSQIIKKQGFIYPNHNYEQPKNQSNLHLSKIEFKIKKNVNHHRYFSNLDRITKNQYKNITKSTQESCRQFKSSLKQKKLINNLIF